MVDSAVTTLTTCEQPTGELDVDRRWQASMAPYFTPDCGTPQMLSQYFYLA